MSDEQSAKSNNVSRQAKLPATEDGDRLGVCLYLTPTELAALDVSVDEIEELTYTIDTDAGRIKLNGGKK